ncbi:MULTISPECIES: NAD(P)-dependent oxidoreductase [unclassified Staphylococcus]|uniref:precorrin-2 dehydrogenase/sirohydrochlorin ferrochelatase family protein n=1 Tax=unclassified Staphylococcus TaxID=91994 RepID=UPI0021D0DC68|nr:MULTISPECIES: NAD(P)-dependent oxidoreductase [unclassified Staphylococcus]UXR78124.1 NAD(P)-dependent oxidoreductase [Staphylococcus sp. IVB6227]UXR82288.1 NAD(P)-dependent oxidoreductase [Staphylococcus sp. IVB6214]
MYPIQLNLCDKHVVIVGGGKIAWRKFQGLIHEDCRIDVVSPQFYEGFMSKQWRTSVRLIHKDYEADDIAAADLIIVATDRADVNDRVVRDATDSQWVNHTGDRHQSDFFNTLNIRHDDMTISISSSGQSIRKTQAYAKKIKAYLKTLEEDIHE